MHRSHLKLNESSPRKPYRLKAPERFRISAELCGLFQVLCMGVAVGNVAMTPDELRRDMVY